ncbi:MAG: NAD(+)/NADH kinase [Anaerolineales bacterium]
MDKPAPIIRRAALLVHPNLDGVEQLSADILSYLHSHEIEANQGWADPEAADDEFGGSDLDLIIALGGDGTMLRAGAHGSRSGTPVLGINLGRVGFLTEVKRDDWRQALDQVLAGDYWLEARMRLSIGLERAGQHVGQWEALNEGVVSRGRTARPIRLRAEVDGRFLATYVADALICSTPTGSTAYALAAGGPILPPRMRNLLLMPVAPHLSVDRGIVLPEGSSVEVHLLEGDDTDLTCDGQVALALRAGDRITVETNDRDALFCRLKDQGYFFRNLMAYLGTEFGPEEEA